MANDRETVTYINTRRMRLDGDMTGPRHLVIDAVDLSRKQDVVNFLTGFKPRMVEFPGNDSVRAVGLENWQLQALAEAGVNYPGARQYPASAVGAQR